MTLETAGLAKNEMKNEHNILEAETEREIHRFIWEYNTETGLALYIISTSTLHIKYGSPNIFAQWNLRSSGSMFA